jgi:hypothetical protein
MRVALTRGSGDIAMAEPLSVLDFLIDLSLEVH